MTELGVVTTIMVLLFVISFALYLGTPDHRSSLMFSIVGAIGHTPESVNSQTYIQFLALFGVVAATTIAAVLFGAPSQYVPFIGIATLLLGFVTLPTDLMVNAELPLPIQILIAGAFSIMYILGLLGWFKGGGRP